MNSKDNFGTNF